MMDLWKLMVGCLGSLRRYFGQFLTVKNFELANLRWSKRFWELKNGPGCFGFMKIGANQESRYFEAPDEFKFVNHGGDDLKCVFIS